MTDQERLRLVESSLDDLPIPKIVKPAKSLPSFWVRILQIRVDNLVFFLENWGFAGNLAEEHFKDHTGRTAESIVGQYAAWPNPTNPSNGRVCGSLDAVDHYHIWRIPRAKSLTNDGLIAVYEDDKNNLWADYGELF